MTHNLGRWQTVVHCVYAGWLSDFAGVAPLWEDEAAQDACALIQFDAEALRLVCPNEDSQTATVELVCAELARQLVQFDTMDWSAFDPATRTVWNPLEQSYQGFVHFYPDAYPCIVARERGAFAREMADLLVNGQLLASVPWIS